MNLSSTSSASSSSSTGSWFSGVVRGRSDRSGSVKMGSDSVSGGSGDFSGSVVRKNQFRGVLFKYGPKPIQVCQSVILFSCFRIVLHLIQILVGRGVLRARSLFGSWSF